MVAALNILSIFNLFGLALLIALRRHNVFANRVLAITLVCSATDFVINFLSYSGLLYPFRYLVYLNFSFLWSPLVALYVILMLDVRWKFSLKHIIHLIPQFLSWAYWTYVFIQGNKYVEVLLIERKNGLYSWQIQSFQIVIIFQSVFYLGYSAWLIRKKQHDKEFKKFPLITFHWLKQFIYILSALIFLLTVFSFVVAPVIIDYIIAPILYGISNVFLVYKGLNSSGIFSNTTSDEAVTLSKERYTGSTLKPEQIAEYKLKLVTYLNKDEPYTNAELTLNDLAAQTDMQVHHLSQVINQEFEKNFFDLINSYRIEKSKSLMTDSKNDNLTLEAIGLQSGFGSASSFYRAFKKQTGITPKAYLKTQNLINKNLIS